MSTTESDRIVANRYRLSKLLGEGNNGQVWESEDLLAGERVAVKLLNLSVSPDPARVRREISALRLLCIPGVVRLLDEGMDHGQPFMVMELVDGAPFPGLGNAGPPSRSRTKAAQPWAVVADRTIALLETLARIHGAGIFHRDLKPANVLVNASGRPTVLDFGLALGKRLGEGLTDEHMILGTPAYLAPEQINGAQIDARTDLYSFGVMLYEILSGRLPQNPESLQALLITRLTQRPTPLKDVAPEVPSSVAEVVDVLLACSADDRPRSAGEVLAMLRGQPLAPSTEPILPRLGGDAPVRALVDAARAGRSLMLSGASGSGRSRCLNEAAMVLRAEDRVVVSIRPARRPFGSLEPLLGSLEEQGAAGLEAVTRDVEERIVRELASGVILFADDAERIDRWSAGALARCRSHGAIIEAVLEPYEQDAVRKPPEPTEPGEVIHLEPLDEAALHRLFAGPERVFHLRTDCARTFWARTGGLPARVVDEVTALVRAGIARWSGDALAIDRDAIDWLDAGLHVALPPRSVSSAPRPPHSLTPPLEELLTWMNLCWPETSVSLLSTAMGQPTWRIEAEIDELVHQGTARRLPHGRIEPVATIQAQQIWSSGRRSGAHRAIAAALPPGSDGRLLHLIAGQEETDAAQSYAIAEEALTLARRLTAVGHLGRALAALREGLIALRHVAGHADFNDPEGKPAILEEQLLAHWVEIALSDGTAHACDRVLYELCRAPVRSAAITQLESLVRAALETLGAAGERALEAVSAIPPFPQLDMERWRQEIRVFAARHCSEEREAEVLEEAAGWARGSADPHAQASLAGWLGWLRYRQGRFDEAAELQFASAEGEPRVTAKVFKIVSSAGALLETFRLQEAAERAQAALLLCRSFRHPHHEARAEWILRAVAYRMGMTEGADLEFVDAVTLVGVPAFEALVCLTEAAIAWRADQGPLAPEFARKAHRLWVKVGNQWGRLLARCLSLVIGESPEAGEIASLAQAAMRCPITGIGVQALGLLGMARLLPPGPWHGAAGALTRGVDPSRWDLRIDILSITEALSGMGVPHDVALKQRAGG